MQVLKSILEWWRLLGATIWQLPLAATVLALPFTKWSLTIDSWLKALQPPWLTALVCILSVCFFLSMIYVLKLKKELSNKLTLKYNIYWDKKKNPYCPVCQKPVVYNCWAYGGGTWGYYCNPCKHVHLLVDALGNEVKPEKVLSEL